MNPSKQFSFSWLAKLGYFLFSVGTACSGWAADKSYCVQVDYSAVPSLVNYRKITLIVNVGTCASVAVTADGTAVSATYSPSAGTATFTTTGSSIVVTAQNWTAGGTGAATKATLYNNFHWAYSLTFDDNRLSQYDYGKPLLDALGWRAGEAVVGSWANEGGASGSGSYFMNWTCLQALRAAGWDMYDHSYDHPNPLTCNGSATDIDPELANNEPLLLKYFPGYNVTQMVFPYEVSTANTCAGYPTSYLLSAECGGGSYNYVDTTLPFQVQRGGLFGTDDTAWKSLAASSAAQTRPTWLVQYTHSVSQGSGAAADAYSTNQTTLNDLLTYLNTTFGVTGSNNMWFAPAGEVRDYIFTRDNAVVTTCTAAATPTFTNTSTNTATNTATNAATQTPTNTATHSATVTSTNTPTRTSTNTATQTATNTATLTPAITSTFTNTVTNTATNTASSTATNSATSTSTHTSTNTATTTATNTPTQTTTNTATITPAITNTFTNTATNTPTSTTTHTATNTATTTTTNTATQTATNTSTLTPANTGTFTNTATHTSTSTTSSTATNTPTPTATNTLTHTATTTPTVTSTYSKTNTPTATLTSTPTNTFTPTGTPTITPTYTPTITSEIVISAPFPNPSNGTPITFNIQVPSESTVTLDVFTLAFRKIYSETTQADGPLTLQWDLKDVSGVQVANGVYYVRIHVSGSQSATKIIKVLILR